MKQKLLKPEEARALLRLSRSGFYALAKRGEIPTVRIGRLLFVPYRAIERMINEPLDRPEVEVR